MSIPLDEFDTAAVAADFKRDRWGRPSIMQADGKRKSYTRSSSAAKTIEDTFNLEKWARRNVAYGFAHDASLVARVLAIGGEPAAWGKSEKDAVNAIVESAEAVAKAHRAADIGTAVHKLTERLDLGEEVVGGPYQADLDAYAAAMGAAGFTVLEVECRIVNDELEMAGTADRIVKASGHLLSAIADIKTSASVDFGGLGWAAQLAAYAGGVLYDVTTETRIDTPVMDQEVGYIIHLPAGQGACTIYEVDLVGGLMAARLANEVRAIRKTSKRWITPKIEREAVGGMTTAPPPPALDRDALVARYNALGVDLQERFKEKAIPKTDLAAIAAALDELEHPPTVVDMARERMAREVNRKPEPVNDDEGGPADEGDVNAAKTRFELGMSPEQRAWTGAIVRQSIDAGRDIRVTVRSTQRRADIYTALTKFATSPHWDADSDEGFRAAVYVATGDASAFWPTLTLGDALGQLAAGQARELRDVVDAIARDLLVATVDEATQTLRWVRPPAAWTQATSEKENRS